MPTDNWSAAGAARMTQAALQAGGDRDRAAQMSAYMRDRYRFSGVSRADRDPILRRLVSDYPVTTRRQYVELVTALWSLPEREAKYLALGLARRWRVGHVPAHLPMFRRMIVEGDWWDVVDSLASHMVGAVIAADPERAWRTVDPWLHHRNMWLRRTNIICQLGRKQETDVQRLFASCSARAHETDFFIRKAIGWALREYAKTDPDAVAAFVVEHRDELSGLSIREATKHLGSLW